MSSISETPKPPYYAAIFTNLQTEDLEGYPETAARMEALARGRDGFLGIESARQGLGITISYWRDLESIAAWKADLDHQMAQRLGRQRWYSAFKARIARVERDYGFSRD